MASRTILLTGAEFCKPFSKIIMLVPWVDVFMFDGRALLDFIRENDGKFRVQREKTEEEKEIEEHVNFERYRDLIKHKRRGLNDEQGLDDVEHELEAKAMAPFISDRQRLAQSVQPGSGTYAQVSFTYDGNTKDDYSDSDGVDEEEEEEDVSSSEDSEDGEIDAIAKQFGVKRFNWLIYMDRKAKEEEKKQKEAIKGDPAMRKLSRKERRKASQQEREKEREALRLGSNRISYQDPYRETRGGPTYENYLRSRRERSMSRSPSPSSFKSKTRESESSLNKSRSKVPTTKIEYITEFGSPFEEPGSTTGMSPPSSPPRVDPSNWVPGSEKILEALHNDPAALIGIPADKERNTHDIRGTVSASAAIAKLSKPAPAAGVLTKTLHGEKKETPQERLKRIMSKQLNRQIKKDTVTELAKKREQDRLRQEKLAETRRIAQQHRRSWSRSRSRSLTRSPSPYRYRHSRSRSPVRRYCRSPS